MGASKASLTAALSALSEIMLQAEALTNPTAVIKRPILSFFQSLQQATYTR